MARRVVRLACHTAEVYFRSRFVGRLYQNVVPLTFFAAR